MWRGAEENIALAVLQLLPDRHAYLVVNCIVFIVFIIMSCILVTCMHVPWMFHAYLIHAGKLRTCMSISRLRHAFDIKHVSSLHEKYPKFILFHETCMYFNMKACISMHVTVCMLLGNFS